MSGSVAISEAPTTGLGKLITENRFFVPTHQRDYRWDSEKVEKLFDDFVDAMERKDQFYFIGLMVFMREGERLRVLDGQQRLATTIIILAAIRAWFLTNDSSGDTAKSILTDFIGRADYGEAERSPKMSLNYNNDSRFQQYITNGPALSAMTRELPTLNKHAPNYPLLRAISYCNDRVEKVAKGYGEVSTAQAYLVALLKFIRDNVIVVRLTVPNEVNAFRVFETLNDRGMDLSAVDLVKNYLFGLANDVSPEMLADLERRWLQITQELQSVKEEEFLRTYWTSRNGRVQLEDVFDNVQKKCKTGSEAATLSIDLLKSAEQYAALDSADDPVWAPHTPKTREMIATMRALGFKQVRPVILSALERFDPREFERLLRLLEVIEVRWQLIGEQRTGAIEIQCARLALSIWEGKTKGAAEARSLLDTVYLKDPEFQAQFTAKEGLSNPKAAYILRKIEDHERAKRRSDLVASRALTIEHVLPRNPDQHWNAEIKACPELGECTERLGNMCLLAEARNREAGRVPFTNKKQIFSTSELLTTQEIAKYETWDAAAIGQHQAWLASRAVEVWRFP